MTATRQTQQPRRPRTRSVRKPTSTSTSTSTSNHAAEEPRRSGPHWRQAARADALLDMPLPEIELPAKPERSEYRGADGAGTTCGICTSFEREEIEQWIVVGRSMRDTARRFGIGKDAVLRHKQGHMPKLDEDRAMRETLSKAKAVARLRLATEIHEHAARELANGRHHRDASAAAKNLQDASKLAGQIGGWFVEKQQVSALVGVIDLDRVLGDIVRALQPHPAALQAIDHILADREIGAGALE